MTSPQLTAVNVAPPQAKSEEPTKDQPLEGQDPYENQLAEYGVKLIELANQVRNGWQWKRRGIVLKVLKNKEFLKGNHHIGFYPGTYDSFDAIEEYSNFTGAKSTQDADRSMDQRPHNFYQMLENALEGALSAQIPKNRWLPSDANIEEDRETAKGASTVEEIIERANNTPGMLKQEIMEIATAGGYFKHTRYVVDADRTGTQKQTTWQMLASEILPARYQCFSCGMTTPEDELVGQQKQSVPGVGDVVKTGLACPNCGTPFSQENYFEDHVEQVPVAEQKDDVARGMVLQSVYNALHVDGDPDAGELRDTSLLNVSQEVSRGWLKMTFKKYWDKFNQAQTGGGASTELLDRQYREMMTTPAGYSAFSTFTNQAKDTYSRCWLQPMAFAESEDRQFAEKLLKEFPKGVMIAFVGEMPLQLRPAVLTKEWTWCPSKKGFGLFPPPLLDPAVPVQERLNDSIAKIDEYMDRLACGILLANEKYIDSKAMNGKAMLPGILNPVATKSGAERVPLQDMIFQLRAEIDAEIFTYTSMLKQDMELLVGAPPQTFGGGTQDGVETMGGQQQQLNTGMIKMGLTWQLIREEHAQAAENAVMCAAKNMTQDWLSVVTDETEEFRNQYVHMEEMKGSVHAEPETDQGFPMTWAEIKDFYQNLFENANNPFVTWLMAEPENVDNALRYIAIPGLVAPGAKMRSKMLSIINQLVQSGPSQAPDPVSGQPMDVPTVLPNKYLDDLSASQKMIENWSQENWDKLQNNEAGLNNLVAYYKMCAVFEHEIAAEQQVIQGPQNPQQNSKQPSGAA